MRSNNRGTSPAAEVIMDESSSSTPNDSAPSGGGDYHQKALVTNEQDYVHPESMGIANCAPVILRIPFYGRSVQYLGPKVPSMLAICNFMQRGLANNLINYSKFAMFRSRFGISAERYQRLAGIAGLGWSLMAFTAVFTDTFAFVFHTKRWYLVISCLLGFAFALGFALLPAQQSSANTGAAFMFLTVWSIANVIILVAGQYSRLLRKSPRAGPPLVGVVYSCIMIGGIISAGVQGPLSDRNLQQVGMYIAAVAQLVPAAFFAMNWLQEKTNEKERLEDCENNYQQALIEARRWDEEHGLSSSTENEEGDDSGGVVVKRLDADDEENDSPRAPVVAAALEDELDNNNPPPTAAAHPDGAPPRRVDQVVREEPRITRVLLGIIEVNHTVVTDNWKIVLYCVVMTAGVIAMTVVTVLGNSYDLLYCSIAVSVVCILLAFYSLPLAIAKANVYIFLQQLFYLQLPGALDSFYMAPASCLPEGPHFTYTFYTTVGSIIGNVGGLIGVALFTYVFSKMSYRVTMVVATIVQIIASIFDLIIVKRWNVAIGIPDHAMYILGDQIVYQTCYYLSYMPIVLLLSRLLPRGTECMVMAVMSSLGNFGAALSNSVGALVMELGWPVVADVANNVCDFKNVPYLILVGHFACPLLIFPLTLMLPAAKISDDIDIDGKVIRKKVQAAAEEEEEEEGHARENHPAASEPLREDH
ncbi:putative pteridine transporter ft5 [Leptomonas pyrrhocoris]|uniref:Putative pteridine transporter ft5 n=1 Tax=Leptomonas pyrrhocoris TaxID=157538 RepID=A0A0M9FXS2_LEPPY|nr:putative pteridine transporter ft5 [Leptomonas pyrrhocoris]KPA78290.1 putative pteridine transporter ft5 [Leptomonas pyrrhocoris]|eukprot:XP_015656729.1 putative pteridine transporter ft5 [Leptomonas pyrrhocoris]